MADRVNELTQNLIEAKSRAHSEKGALDAIIAEQGKNKATLRALLRVKASDKGLPDEDNPKLEAAEKADASFDARLSAQRKLVAEADGEVLQLEKDLEAERKRLAAEDRSLAQAPSGRLAAATGVAVGAPNATKDPKRGFNDHKDFLVAVMRFGVSGGRICDERLKPLAAIQRIGGDGGGAKGPFAAAGSDEQGVYSDPAGGFLVPVGVAPGILSVSPEDDPLAGLVTNVPMMAPTVKFNARVDKNHSTSVSGGLVVSRRPETVEGSSSRMLFEQVTLTANEEFGLAFASEQVLQDSPVSFVAILQAGFRDEYVAAAMRERIDGTGVGERLGILNSPCLITVLKETNQAAASIKKENIDKMEARCWRYGRAVWLGNHNIRPQLKSLVQVVGTGGNAVPYFTASAAGGPEQLSGRPIFFTEFAKSLGTLGDLILVVPSEYLEGQYQSEQYAESIHVRFVSGERAFRFYRRNDGQPWWRSALTPVNGDTLSPFVVLETRS